jgi:type II secretory pathway component PulL
MRGSDDIDALAERTIELAVVAQALDERSERATVGLEKATRDMAAAAAQFGQLGDRIAGEATQAIARQAQERIDEAVATALAASTSAFDAHASRVRELEGALQCRTDALAGWQRRWLMAVPAIVLAGCALAVAGTLAWTGQARREAERYRIEADLLRAYNAADVTLCGGRLCARIDAAGRVDRRGYRPVAPREPRE